MNANWFNAMVEFSNTVKAIRRNFGVSRAIAKHIQSIAAQGATQAQCESVARASAELCNQVGF